LSCSGSRIADRQRWYRSPTSVSSALRILCRCSAIMSAWSAKMSAPKAGVRETETSPALPRPQLPGVRRHAGGGHEPAGDADPPGPIEALDRVGARPRTTLSACCSVPRSRRIWRGESTTGSAAWAVVICPPRAGGVRASGVLPLASGTSVLLFMGKRADRMAEQLGADIIAEQRQRATDTCLVYGTSITLGQNVYPSRRTRRRGIPSPSALP
jgi:hypothetical protein